MLALLAACAAAAPRSLADDAPAPPTVSVPTYENVACPITGQPATRTHFVDTEYGRVYVCSKGCVAKVQANPIPSYQIAYPTVQTIKNQVCPVTGEDVGYSPVKVVLQGNEFNVKDQDAAMKARANSQIVLVKVVRKNVVDVANPFCPVTGQAVVDNAFCLIGNDLVHLSSPAAVDEVRKDPVKALANAKESATKKAPPASPLAPGSATKPKDKPPAMK